jgi:CheY-like chemotaxis protein
MRLNQATVLVADDELELLEIFSAWLGRCGCRVLTAANGAEALKVLAREKVDALISDIRMPVMDGVALLRRVHQLGLTIPSIIFISGFGEVEPREMYALGAELLLEKPFSRQQLLAALENSLREREELWLTPVPGPAGRSLSIAIEGLDEATRARSFQLGRGGCCFLSPQPVTLNERVELSILVSGEQLTVRAQGGVRWYCTADRWAGLEFLYLEPEGRSWVLDRIKNAATRSFIPGSVVLGVPA